MSNISPKYLAKLEKWFYNGLSIESCDQTAEQKMRTKIVYEAYNRWLQDKQINVYDVVRRIAQREYAMALTLAAQGNALAQEFVQGCKIQPGRQRTAVELSNDVRAFNHIIAYLSVDEHAVDKMKVHDAADFLLREGKKMGNMQSVRQGADLLMQLNNNFNEQQNAADQMPSLDLNITGDVTIIKRDRYNYTDEEREKLKRRVGMTDAEFTELKQASDGSWIMPDEDTEEEDNQELDSIALDGLNTNFTN